MSPFSGLKSDTQRFEEWFCKALTTFLRLMDSKNEQVALKSAEEVVGLPSAWMRHGREIFPIIANRLSESSRPSGLSNPHPGKRDTPPESRLGRTNELGHRRHSRRPDM